MFQSYRDYDVVPGGNDLVLIVPTGDTASAPEPPRPQVNIVINWHEELKRLVP